MTYSDVGGCKEQIEKLREVVEVPLLHVSLHNYNQQICLFCKYGTFLQNESN